MMRIKLFIILTTILFGIIGVAYFSKSQCPISTNFGASINLATFTKGLDIQVMVKIKQQTSEGEYNDTLYYTLDQWAAKSAADIEADKQARVDKWVNYVKAAKTAPPYIPTKEELQRQAEELQNQLNNLNAQIAK